MISVGNVLKNKHGSIVIISRIRDKDYAEWVSFNSTNSAGRSHIKTHFRTEMCWTCDINDGGEPDEECECCHGTGEYEKEIIGLEEWKFLGYNIEQYIKTALFKNNDKRIYKWRITIQ